MCLFLWGFLSLWYSGLCFLLGSGTRIIKKCGRKKSEILDDLINISPIHSLCVAFCFFLLVFSLGFMFAYLLSLGSSFVKRLADLGRSPVRGFFGLFNDMGLFWGCLSGFLRLLLRCQSWLVLDFAAISGVYL